MTRPGLPYARTIRMKQCPGADHGVPAPRATLSGRVVERQERRASSGPRATRLAVGVVASVALGLGGCAPPPPPEGDHVPAPARWAGDDEESLVLMSDGVGTAQGLPYALTPTCDPRLVVEMSGDVQWEQVTRTEVVVRQGDVSITVWADREKFSGDPIWRDVRVTPCTTGTYGWQSVDMMRTSLE